VRLRDLQAAASVALVLMGSMTQPGMAQVQKGSGKTAAGQSTAAGQQDLPTAPTPNQTEPLYLRDTPKDYTQPRHQSLVHPFAAYKPLDYPLPRLSNTPRLTDLVRDGKLYLSLSDAVALALENNFDIAIARINLDIADTDVLRARAGGALLGVSTGLVTGTLGGTTTTITGGGGPGGTSASSGGSSTGTSGLTLSENGTGPAPELLDPTVTGTIQYESAATQQSSTLITGTNTLNQNTTTYNFGYQQGFLTGTALSVTFDNSHTTTNSQRTSFSPLLNSSFRAQATQHLLQGFGTWINGRFIIQAKNNRRITDSAFRQQVIYTVTQVESIYWALVSAYEDVQAKERALDQSTKLTADNRKQLEIGTLAPLDVVNSDSAVATDKQALIASNTNLQYQQLLMKQAIARNLIDKSLVDAPVIPTDRVGLERLAEEDMTADQLVEQAYTNNPQIEQAVLTMKNNEITIRALKNGLLPTVDAYAFYGGSGVGGSQNSALNCATSIGSGTFTACPPGYVASSNFGNVLGNTFNNTSPDYGAGVNINIPLRNRINQAAQARSQMEYRQTQMRLQQLYVQIRISVINSQYALTNDRAQVQAAQATRDFAAQSLDAEQKKYKLGASTTANVLSQERTLATAEDNLISAVAAYARDRSSLRQLLSNTLDQYGISLVDTAMDQVNQTPKIPGLTAPKGPEPAKPITVTPDPSSAPTVPVPPSPRQ
jgi:outer membrane protein